MPNFHFLSRSSSRVQLRNIDLMLKDNHMVFPDLKKNSFQGYLGNRHEQRVIHRNGEVVHIGMSENIGEIKLFLPQEGEVLTVYLPVRSEMQMVKVNKEIALHYKLYKTNKKVTDSREI